MSGLSALLAVAVLLGQPRAAQQQPPPKPDTLDHTIDAGEAETEEPARKLVSWNEFDGKYLTLRFGGGFLYDVTNYSQDDASREQFDLRPGNKVRDARLTFKGRLKFIKSREVTYTSGIMYDGPSGKWLVRETGVMVQIAEHWGYIFVGRTKEGFSLNKVMVGYAGWTMERSTVNDAMIPILADGVKWLGYSSKLDVIWNIGFYGDALSVGQSFSTYRNQVAGRLAWVPIMSEKTETVLHLGFSARYGKPKDDTLQLRSRPENFIAPYFVDTGKFTAGSSTMFALEAYYRPGPLLFGSEYFWQKPDAPTAGNPLFHGGEVVATWLMTGETRVYNTKGGYFNQISPLRPVFTGGLGAWELVGHFSYIDLDSGTLTGGKFWRITPMVNWYLSDHARLELNYGYGSLDRFNLVGRTHFFQSRLQLQF
jgi:phosphate-selective porin OprO/OprP